MPSSPSKLSLFTGVALVSAAFAVTVAELPNSGAALTSAAAVRGLPPEEAAKGLPVNLAGVVTFMFNTRSYFVQDQSAGIYVGNGVESPPLSPGDTVVIEGVSDPGEYAPIVRPSAVRVLGRTNLPSPTRVSYADLMTGRHDSQWVEIVGLVRAADEGPQGAGALEIDLGGGRVTTFLPATPQPRTVEFVDSTVRVRGVCGTWFNRSRQLFGVRLMVPRWEDIIVEEAAPPDVLGQPARAIGSLLRFTPEGAYGHRVKVAGTVVLHQAGRALFVQDQQHGLYVQTRQAGKLEPGDRVEVLGFPDKGEYTPVMQDAVWRKTGSGPEPAPVVVRADEALSGLQDCRFIEIEGELLDQTRNSMETVLVIGVEGHLFSAHLQSVQSGNALAGLEKHSQLRIRGVCRIQVGEEWRAGPEWRAKGFQVLLRSPADVDVLSLPPWWTLRRLLWAVAVLAAVVVAALLWAALLRRKVTQQTSIIRQQLDSEARLKERYRDLFESANDMVYTHDLTGLITSVNEAGERFLEHKRGELIGKNLVDFIAEEQRPAARRWLEDIVDGAAPATVEWDFLNSGGERVRLETSTRLIHHQGEEVEVEGIARDVTERRRLEREILEISTREQRRIGHDLHDGVCQQLAGISMLADVLADKLEERLQPEAREARKISELTSQANRQTRGVARGLFPVRLEANGLVSALDELTQGAAAFYKTACEFRAEKPVIVRDPTVALHLYYIAQEAIINAVRHGKARHIEVILSQSNAESATLRVRNDGEPFTPPAAQARGMGIRIMKYRARMIGAVLTAGAVPGGGTEVCCDFGLRASPWVPAGTPPASSAP